MTSLCKYTDTSYLGGCGHSDSHYPDSDLLFGMPDTYQYGSTITTTSPEGNETRVLHTYNNYHLQVSEEKVTGKCSYQEVTGYPLFPKRGFDRQPYIYQVPKSKICTWLDEKGLTRQEITTYDYEKDADNAYVRSGNLTSTTAPDGTQTLSKSYPAAGEQNGCPPDPSGFTRYLKSQTVIPPAITGDELTHITTYTYEKLPLKQGAGIRMSGNVKEKTS